VYLLIFDLIKKKKIFFYELNFIKKNKGKWSRKKEIEKNQFIILIIKIKKKKIFFKIYNNKELKIKINFFFLKMEEIE
jgi:hypothetical protein